MPPAGEPRHVAAVCLPAELADRIRGHALRAYPAEACGFLLGGADDGHVAVTAVRSERNRAATNDRFVIDATDVFRALQAARGDGVEVLGVYHSHPDGNAEPSPTDRREAWGGWLHLIVACDGDEARPLRCWIETAGAWRPVPIDEDAA